MFKLRSFLGSRVVSLGALVGALPLAACGGAAPKAAAAPSAAISAAPMTKEEAPDLSAVPAPAELVALARFKAPRTAVETVAAWAGLPYKLQDVLPAELKDLESVVAWDAPLEAAVALDPSGEGKVPQPLAVVSLGLTSLDAALTFARGRGQRVRQLRAGVFRIGEADDWSCTAGVALGRAPARLVCGERARDVDGLFNYATRGLPNEPLPAVDFQVELRLAPVKTKYAAEIGSARLLGGFLLREVQLDNPRFDRALSDVAYGLIDETTAFVQDLNKARLEGSLDTAKGVASLRFETQFAGQKSWLVQASAETVGMAEPAPETFWQLPADSTGASYSVGWKPSRLKALGHTLSDLLDAFLATQKVPTGLRDQSTKALDAAFNMNTKYVLARGELADIPSEPMLAADYRTLGWQIAGIDGDPKALLTLLDGIAGVVNSRDLPRVLKAQGLILDPKLMFKLSTHAVSLKGFKPGAKAYRIDVPVEIFSKLAKEFSVELPAAKAKAAVKALPVSIIVAFDGERTWAGESPDEKALIKRLEALKDPKQPVLRTREGLEALKGASRHAGGFLSIASFSRQLSAAGAADADSDQIISALPHHGRTPILYSAEVNANGPVVSSSFTVPRASVEDLGALMPVLVQLAGKHHALATP
ncbi:MAG: hypothetical protein ABJB12_23470 [Pseudomonadota bacterium]